MDIDIRPCVAAEVAVLAALEPAGRGFASQAFTNQDEGRSTFLIAWHGQTPCGSCEVTLGVQPALLNLNVGEIVRGQGVGTALIRAAESVVGPSGELSIGVATDNSAARRLYERLGYRTTGACRETTYTYVDDDNREHTVTEIDETLRRTWDPDQASGSDR